MRLLLLLLALAASAGCQVLQRSGPRDVAFTTNQARYAPGASVTLRLANHTEETLGYNLCTASLERQSAQDWQAAGDPDVCTLIQYGLEAGADTTYTKTLDASLSEGTYRFSTVVEYRGSGRRETLATQPFTVER